MKVLVADNVDVGVDIDVDDDKVVLSPAPDPTILQIIIDFIQITTDTPIRYYHVHVVLLLHGPG